MKLSFCKFLQGVSAMTMSGILLHLGSRAPLLNDRQCMDSRQNESPCLLPGFLAFSLDIMHHFLQNFTNNCSFHKAMSSMALPFMIFELPLYQF